MELFELLASHQISHNRYCYNFHCSVGGGYNYPDPETRPRKRTASQIRSRKLLRILISAPTSLTSFWRMLGKVHAQKVRFSIESFQI